MSSISQLSSETQKDFIEKEQSNSIFNSKLFLYLDTDNTYNQEENNESTNQSFNDNLEELDEINFLSNELIRELNSCCMNIQENNEFQDENKINTNIINSLISLAKDGYEFKPKNYKASNNDKIDNKNYHYNNSNFKFKNRYNKYKNNKKNFHRGFNYINDKVSVV